MSGIPLGNDCVMLRGSVEVLDVMNVKLTLGKKEADVTTRRNKKFEVVRPTFKQVSASFDLLVNESVPASVADFEAFYTSYINDSLMTMTFQDGPGTSSYGVRGEFQVMKMDRDESNDQAVKYSVEMKLGPGTAATEFLKNGAVYPPVT